MAYWKWNRWGLAWLAIGGLSACVSTTVPPAEVQVPAHWQAPVAGRQGALSQTWWRDLGSAELSQYIEEALRANRDLRAAAARVAQARAQAGVVDSAQQPHLDAVASGNKGRQTILDPKSTVLRGGLQASWEPDVFGRLRLDSQAAQLDAEGAELLRQGTETVVAAEVATTYLDAGILERRQALGEQKIAVLQQAVAVAQKQFAAGRVTRVTIQQQELALRAEQVAQSQLQVAVQQRLLQLNTLLGKAPGQVRPTFAGFDQIRMPAPAPWLPGELLERRPDVQQQSKALAAATARLGLAKLDLYPRFVFSWSGGREYAKLKGGNPMTEVALAYGLSIALPILDGGRIRAQIQVQEATVQEAMANYEKAMLNALADAELALIRQDASVQSLAQLDQARAAAELQQKDLQRLFQAGQVDRDRVLAGDLALLQAEDQLLQGQSAHWLAGVDVYRMFSGRPAATAPAQP